MSAGRDPRPAPLLLKNPEITDDMVHPVPGTVLKIPGTPDHCTVITDNQAKLFAVIILDKDVPVLYGNGFGLFAGKGAVRQPLKYSEIFAHPHLSGDAPYRTGRGRCHSQSFRTGYRLKTRNRHPPAVAAEAPAARPFVHGLSFLRHLFSYRPPPVVPAEADR